MLFHFSQVKGVEWNEAAWVTVAICFAGKKAGTKELLSRKRLRHLENCIIEETKTKPPALRKLWVLFLVVKRFGFNLFTNDNNNMVSRGLREHSLYGLLLSPPLRFSFSFFGPIPFSSVYLSFLFNAYRI